MKKMENLNLVEFAELRLKSMNDFEPAYDNIVLSTGWLNTCRSLFSFSPEIGLANSTVAKFIPLSWQVPQKFFTTDQHPTRNSVHF